MNSFLASSPPREERGIYSQPAAARHAFSSGSHPYGFSGMSLCRYPDIRTKPSQPKTSADAGGKPLRTREGGNGPACPTPGACPKILRNHKLNSDFNNLIKKYDQPLNILMHSLKRHETEPSFGAWLQPLQPQPQPPPGLVVCLTLRTKYSSARNTMTPTTKPCMTAPCVRKSVSFRRPFTPGKISRTLLIWQGFHFLSTTMKYNFNFLLRFFDFKGSIR